MRKIVILSKIEQVLKDLNKKQKIFVYATPFFIALAILFFVILPIQDDQIQELQTKQTQIQTNINKRSLSKIKKKIKQTQQEILELKEIVQENRDSLNYFYARLNNLDIATLDEKKWMSILDSILNKSLALNISIDSIQNSDSKTKTLKSKLVPKKYVEIVGKGSYANILKYINFIENNQYLKEIKNIKIDKVASQNKEVEFKLNFTIYGIDL